MTDSPALPHPDSIGPYRILRVLGEGRTGVVYLAEQHEPVFRRVALKLLKLGMGSEELRRRFEFEHEALARMSHPSIATVHDSGVTDSGQPYLVMEPIQGTTITRHADADRLDLSRRLELFLDACDAVSHAHQRGVLHLDLSPSNVLVASELSGSGRARARVIDFGVGRRLDGVDANANPALGTPGFRSPEAAAGGDVDTRSDVYSLGALLHALLTGTPPPAIDPRPSLSLRGRSRVDQHALAHDRSTSPARLRRALRGDLDGIVLRALASDPERRYESVAALAEDVRRHIRHETVSARGAGVPYRASRFVRRHRAASIAASCMLVGLLAALLSSAAFLLEARAARSRADEAETSANQRLEELLGLTDRKRLDDLQAAERALWPATPDRVPEMEAWCRSLEALLERTPTHASRLARLREHAVRSDAPLAVEADDEHDESEPELAWQQGLLDDLVRSLEAAAAPDGLLAGMRQRIARAATLGERSLDAHRDAWSEALRSIADTTECPPYKGRVLTPQLGLVPIGRDPDSGLWEFAHIETGEVPRRSVDGRLEMRADSGLVFVLLPAGRLRMGASREPPDDAESLAQTDPQALDGEGPVHEVELDAFFVSKFEMSQGAWTRFTGRNPSGYQSPVVYAGRPIDPRHPVENVSWLEATETLRRLGLELPTEAQWEYATRAGTDTPWWTGRERESVRGAANLADQAAARDGAPWSSIRDWPDLDDGYSVHAPVDEYRANAFGLHGVIANVAEWCRETRTRYDQPARDGDGYRAGDEMSTQRCRRGGSYDRAAAVARSAYREFAPAADRAPTVGLRPVRRIDP